MIGSRKDGFDDPVLFSVQAGCGASGSTISGTPAQPFFTPAAQPSRAFRSGWVTVISAPQARLKKMGNPVRIPHFLVPVAGVEPARPCGHGILSPGRLPIPPHRRKAWVLYSVFLLIARGFLLGKLLQKISICCLSSEKPTQSVANQDLFFNQCCICKEDMIL